MRASTFAFLALFGAFALHRHFQLPLVSLMHERAATVCCPTPDRAASRRTRELQDELTRLERRGRDLERSVQAVTQSARTLRELAGRQDDEAVRAECREVESGLQRLRTLRDRTEVERVAVAARLQLARAGLDDAAGADDDLETRTSPVDALSASERATRRVSARVR